VSGAKERGEGGEPSLYLTCRGDASWWSKSTAQGAMAVLPGFCSWVVALGTRGRAGQCRRGRAGGEARRGAGT
jgi:hypothetical protein